MFTTPKEHIDTLNRKRAKNDENSTTLALTLEANIRTVFSGGYKFIYELLQNADDAVAKSVKFVLLKNRLLVSHNGKHFKQEDVERICSNAEQDGEKVYDINKTGYKGVGFKAVFCISPKVTIVSQAYCFRFDKTIWEETKASKFPWPIIPIWVDYHTIQKKIELDLDKDNVHFLLEEITTGNVQKELDYIFNSPEVLLALRHVKEIMLVVGGTRITLRKEITNLENTEKSIKDTKKTNKSLVKLITEKNERQHASKSYYLYHTSIKTEDIKQELSLLSAAECPGKLKQAEEVSLTFAASLEDNTGSLQIVRQSNTKLYCYLPTEVNAGLPFWVNTDFILHQDRSTLLNNVWNRFLLEQIARVQFEWFSELARDEMFKKSMLNLLSSPDIQYVYEDLKSCYKKGFAKGLKQAKFIPSITPNYLLTFDECVIDETGFFGEFSSDISDKEYCNEGGLRIVDSELMGVENLKRLENLQVDVGLEKHHFKINSYTHNELFERIDDYLFGKENHRTLPTRVISFFMKFFEKNPSRQETFAVILPNKKILLTQKGAFKTPKECYLQEGDLELASKFDLNLVHVAIAGNSSFTSWLRHTLKMAALNPIDIIRYYIADLMEKGLIDRTNTVKYLRYIYSVYVSPLGNELTDEDYFRLSQFPVLVGKGSDLQSMKSSFHPDCKNVPLEMIIAGAYFEGTDSVAKWYALLIRMRIQTKILLHFHVNTQGQRRITVENAIAHLNLLKEPADNFEKYFKTFKNDLPLASSPSKPKMSAELTDFVTFDHFQKIKEKKVEFYYIFWQCILNSWDELYHSRPRYIQSRVTEVEIKTPYVIFYMKTQDCIKVLGKDEYKPSQELFVPLEDSDFSDLPLPLAEIPKRLTLEEAKFFGFKTQPKLEDCLRLLENPVCNSSPEKLMKIYLWLIALNPIHKSEIETIQSWKLTGQLLAADLTLQPAGNLVIDDFMGDLEESSHVLHPCDLHPEELKKLAKLFKLQLTSQQNSNLKIDQEGDEKLAKNNVKSLVNIVLKYLPMAAILEARRNKKSHVDVLREMLDKFLSFDFVYCKKITYVDNKGQKPRSLNTVVEGNTFYFRGRWAVASNRKEIVSHIGKSCFIGISNSVLEKFKLYLLINPTSDDLRNELEEEKMDPELLDECYQFIQLYTKHEDSNNDKDKKSEKDLIEIEGFQFEVINGNGHCLYNAVAMYLNIPQEKLREKVADHIGDNKEEYLNLITAIEEERETNFTRTIEEYIRDIRTGIEWADHIEIAILMKLNNCPIVVIGPDKTIRNRSDVERYEGEPVFVYYNGVDHYDALLIKPGRTGKELLAKLLGNNNDKTLESRRVDISLEEESRDADTSIDHSFNLLVERVDDIELSSDTDLESDTNHADKFLTPQFKQFDPYRKGKRRESTPSPSGSQEKERNRKQGSSFFDMLSSVDINKEEILTRGKVGERDFYNYLLELAKNAQKEGKFSRVDETTDGFEAYDYQNPKLCVLKLDWPNKNGEKYLPLDMMVTYKGKKYIFEVKSTKFSNKNFVNMSSNEWEKMITTKDNYALVCVYNAGSTDPSHLPQVSILWNPSKLVFRNVIKPANCILQWGYQMKRDTILNNHEDEVLGRDKPEVCGECKIQ